MYLSFKESPQLFTIITSEDFNLGAILIASAKACDGSKEGEISSNLVTIYKHLKHPHLLQKYILLFLHLLKNNEEEIYQGNLAQLK